MTRINSNILVKQLTDEHLLVEHREIKRLPKYLEKSIQCGSINKLPNQFTLGTGHVKFFLDKQKFIYNRYREIYNELINRGFEVEDYSDSWKNIDPKYFNDYKPTKEEYELLKQRINERIKESPKNIWHYYKTKITKEKAMGLIP